MIRSINPSKQALQRVAAAELQMRRKSAALLAEQKALQQRLDLALARCDTTSKVVQQQQQQAVPGMAWQAASADLECAAVAEALQRNIERQQLVRQEYTHFLNCKALSPIILAKVCVSLYLCAHAYLCSLITACVWAN